MNSETTARFKVQGMHCQSCVTSVNWEIEDLDGVSEVRTSLADGMTEVNFDPAKVAPQDLVAAIVRAGFTAQPTT